MKSPNRGCVAGGLLPENGEMSKCQSGFQSSCGYQNERVRLFVIEETGNPKSEATVLLRAMFYVRGKLIKCEVVF